MLIVINDASSRDEIQLAISALRAKQCNAQLQLIRDEIDADLNDLLDLWRGAMMEWERQLLEAGPSSAPDGHGQGQVQHR